ncbi:hypothetical protein [Streptomyces sparsus]
MTVDPTDPDTFETPADDGTHPAVPEADAAEQQAELLPTDDDDAGTGASGGASGAPIDPADAVNDADAAEQARIVEIDEDDYR